MRRLRTAAAAVLALAGVALGQSPAAAMTPAAAGVAAAALSVQPSSGTSGSLVTIGSDLTSTATPCTLAQDGISVRDVSCGPRSTIQFTVSGRPGRHTITLCAPTCSPLVAATTASAVFTILAVVPPLIGLSESALPRTLAAAGLKLGTVTGAAGGLVVSQDPASGNAVDPDQPISVTLGVATTSPSAVVVPDLHGLRVARARELTRSVGLKLVASSAAGYVQSQKPPAGTSVDANTTVTVTVRARVNVRFVVVPDLRGDSVDTARITLAGVGLALSSPATTGTVATQDLPPGRRVATGTIVTVTLELVASPTSSRTRSTPGWHWAVAAGAVLVLLASAGGITVRRLRRRRARPRPTAGPPPRVTCRATAAVVHTRSTRVPAPTVELRIREHATLTTERKP